MTSQEEAKFLIIPLMAGITLAVWLIQKYFDNKKLVKIGREHIEDMTLGIYERIDTEALVRAMEAEPTHKGWGLEHSFIRDGVRYEVTFTNYRKSWSYKAINIAQEIADNIRKEEELKAKQAKEKRIVEARIAAFNKQKRWNLENSPLTNHFGAQEGGTTYLYYLKINRTNTYKIGITKQHGGVRSRYTSSERCQFTVLFEKKIVGAEKIERAIIRHYKSLVTNRNQIGTKGTEIFKEDVLRLAA